MTTYLSAVPAYGRDYQDEASVMADWYAGKDFNIQDIKYQGYVNKDDKPDKVVLKIRYNRKQEFCIIGDIGID